MNRYLYYSFISIGILSVFLPIFSFAKQTPQLYWNGYWDPACEKCWPYPQTKDKDKCTPADCILQGYYRCTKQNPPLKESNNPRILSLIKAGLCVYVPQAVANASDKTNLNIECEMLDRFSGKSATQNTKNTLKDKLLFYFMFMQSLKDPGAKFLLAIFYDNGFGTKQDRGKANELFLDNATANNFPDAQYALGVRYQYGITVPENKASALMWFEKVLSQHAYSDRTINMLQRCAKKHIKEISTE